jgi:hypothetical protein
MAPYHGGPPGAYACICAVEQGWRPPPLTKMVQVITAQESTCEQNITERSCGGALSRVHNSQELGSIR